MSTSSKRMMNLLWIFGLLVVFILVPLVRYSASSENPEDRVFINLGLDLKGGVDLVLAVDRSQYKGEVRQEQMEGAIEVMRRKIDPGGVKEIVVQQVGDERIAVQVPGAKDPEAVKEIIGRPDALKWIDTGKDFLAPRTIVRFVDDVSTLEPGETGFGETPSAGGEKEPTAPAAEPAPAATEETPASNPTGSSEPGATDAAPGPTESGQEPAGESPASGDGTQSDTSGEAQQAPVDVTEGGVVQGTTSEENATEEGEEDYSQYPEEFQKALQPDQGKEEEETPIIITDPNSDRDQVVITGEDLEWVQTTFYNNKPVVSFRIRREAAGKFAKHTGSNIGKYMAIALNNEIISCPVIRSRIGRSGQIDGFTTDEAKQLEMLLNAGRIPVPLKVVQERTVSPTLGEESIRLSLRAGIWGLCMVLIFMFIYYRLPGLLADIALLMYAIFFIGAMSMLNATLTLPGIAGVILSLGMAVDANVIIFERLKEELGVGKTVATAVKDAFKRAWTAILDANVTTLITGFILWSIGSGPIKGFAVTLCMGILLSMFTALYVTRNLLEAIITLPAMQKRWLLGAKRGVR